MKITLQIKLTPLFHMLFRSFFNPNSCAIFDNLVSSISNALGQMISPPKSGQFRANFPHATSLSSTLVGGLYTLETRTSKAVIFQSLLSE
ncbi:MAG: hypothetical protein AB8H47_15805 [Bacteroidia bacterium]